MRSRTVSTHTDLSASIRFSATELEVRNNDSFDWADVKLEINGGVFSRGYLLSVPRIAAGKDCVRALVLKHTCDGNDNGRDGGGIHSTSSSNRIDGNKVTDNERGIDVDTKGSLILKNNASGNIPWCTGGGPPTQ